MTRARGESGSAVLNLPVELLLDCLRAADPSTRVRASHVSHGWRSIALSDSRLWDSFVCSYFRDVQHQDTMFEQLRAMLLRSRSLPFRLRIPHRYHGGSFAYRCRLLELEELDIRRLVLYGGPFDVFSRLVRDRTPLPTLTSLNVIEPNVMSDPATIDMASLFSGHNFPNLERLQAPLISLSPASRPLPALQHLVCSLDDAGDIVHLCYVFPNIVSLEITMVKPSCPFPTVSLPASLRTIVLCPFGRFDVDVLWTLQDWDGTQIPRLVVRAASTARGILSLFDGMHPHAVDLRLNGLDGEIVLSSPEKEFIWTITPSPKSLATFIGGLEPEARTCERLTSISVGMEQLGRLFAAQLHVPALDRLDFRLDGSQHQPLLPDGGFVIRVPRLQHVTFSMDGRSDAIRARMDEIQSVLVVLLASFRTLIVYDANLLDSVTLSAPAASVKTIDCSSFARFAKEYRICSME